MRAEMKMFRRKKKRIARSDFPQGVCLKTDKGYFYVNGKTVKLVPSLRVFKSWSFPIVIEVHSSALSGFIRSAPLGFRDGTLIKDISDGRIYIVSKRVARQIVSPDALDMLGKKRSDAIWVSKDEIKIHEKGEDL